MLLKKYRKLNVFILNSYRQFTAGKDGNLTSIADKFLRSVSDLKKAKMSMQNQWKLLSQLRDYLNKSSYDKTQQISLPKDWLDALQKLTYSQLETIRKLSSYESNKITDTGVKSNVKHADSNDSEVTARLPSMSETAPSLTDNFVATTKMRQVNTSEPNKKIICT